MKSEKLKELKTASESELQKLAADKREALRQFRFGISGSKVKNVKEGAKLKKDTARVLTELSSRRREVGGK